jgi:hypothetical protein
MNLDNNEWVNLTSGYKIPYDASVPLRKLKSTDDPETIKAVFEELWENLYHQGDVGTASYYAVPHLVEICISKNSLDWNYVGLCFIIEEARAAANNLSLTSGLEQEYFDSLHKLGDYLLKNFKSINGEITIQAALAFLAMMQGQIKLGSLIYKLDDDMIDQLLNEF